MLSTGQTDVERTFMESEYEKSKTTEHRVLSDLTELKTKHEMLVQENKEMQNHCQTEQDMTVSKNRQSQELRLFTVIKLMDNYTSSINLLYDDIFQVRKDELELWSDSVSLCDKMTFNQVKINSANDLMDHQCLVDEEGSRQTHVHCSSAGFPTFRHDLNLNIQTALHTVRGVGDLGMRMLTLDTKTSHTSKIVGTHSKKRKKNGGDVRLFGAGQ